MSHLPISFLHEVSVFLAERAEFIILYIFSSFQDSHHRSSALRYHEYEFHFLLLQRVCFQVTHLVNRENKNLYFLLQTSKDVPVFHDYYTEKQPDFHQVLIKVHAQNQAKKVLGVSKVYLFAVTQS